MLWEEGKRTCRYTDQSDSGKMENTESEPAFDDVDLKRSDETEGDAVYE